MFDRSEATERPSLLNLVRRIPSLITQLIRDEIDSAKLELTTKLKAAAVGIGILVGGAVLGLFALGVLLTTAILGLSTVMPPWLAALIVGVVLVILTVVLVMLGLSRLKKGVPPVPSESIQSVKQDIAAVKGTRT